jgi:hypothetical protein
MSALSQFLGPNTKFDTTAALGSKVFIPNTGPAPLICKAGGCAWLVAPEPAQVSRTWYCRQDAAILAESATGSSGWFIPTLSQLQNPGYICRTFWDSFSSAIYWSSTEGNTTHACGVNFSNGFACSSSRNSTDSVRAFRVVTY